MNLEKLDIDALYNSELEDYQNGSTALLAELAALRTVATEANHALKRGFCHEELRIAVEDWQTLRSEHDENRQ